MECDKEFQCELRRTKYMKAFERYERDMEIKDAKLYEKGKKKKINIAKDKEKMKKERNYKKRSREPMNLTQMEIRAMKSLKDRIKHGDIIVSQTDKSSRFAVLTKAQYLQSGKTHTSKDKKISWKDIRFLQSQVNSHVWWLCNILGYGAKTDSQRVLRNKKNNSLEVPDMALLIKDHKACSPGSNKPVPSRPVVSGNRGVNTHLSEIISEFLEPLILEMGSGEVASTEEALNAIEIVNNKMLNGLDRNKDNILEDISLGRHYSAVGMDGMNKYGGDLSPTTQSKISNTRPVVMDGMNKFGGDTSPSTQYTSNITGPVVMDGMNKYGGALSPTTQCQTDISSDSLNESDLDTIDILTDLFMDGGEQRGEKISTMLETSTRQEEKEEKNARRDFGRGDIRNYFPERGSTSPNTTRKNEEKHIKWCESRINTLKSLADKTTSFNEAIQSRCRASNLWRRVSAAKLETVQKSVGSSGCGGGDSNTSMDDVSTTPPPPLPPLQDTTVKPVLIGGDAIALYPSMDMVETAELVAKTVIESRVEFKHINLKYLLVYLKLVLGDEILKENGLGDYIPQRTNWKESKAKSLSCQINKNMDNWSISTEALMWEEERMLVALMIKCAVLALMDSTCYSFGGQLYKQVWGAGIGLRASACMAKIVMGWIDRMWAKVQVSWDLCAYMYFRYIDDLRIYLYPITKGWMWESSGWKYDDKIVDERSSIERTKDEIAKSLNAVSDFIQFTTEGEEDFHNGFLPTLDFQTKVQETGKILFKFFSKPMANNLTIQYGTGLAKNTIFSALRQELIRRLTNCSLEVDGEERLHVINQFIQLLINSGHRYAFIKSVTLQAITRYRYMVMRSKLSTDDEKYKPLYRARSFDHLRRKISKMVEHMTWYRGGG